MIWAEKNGVRFVPVDGKEVALPEQAANLQRIMEPYDLLASADPIQQLHAVDCDTDIGLDALHLVYPRPAHPVDCFLRREVVDRDAMPGPSESLRQARDAMVGSPAAVLRMVWPL